MKEHEQVGIDPCQMRSIQHVAENIPLDSPPATADHLASPSTHSGDHTWQNRDEPVLRKGKTQLEIAQAVSSGEMVVLVMIERPTGEVGGLPGRDWSLRFTEVYRKAGSEWEMVHRHADALVPRISLEQLSALARGIPLRSGG